MSVNYSAKPEAAEPRKNGGVMGKDCSVKRRYTDLSEATAAADSLMDRVALTQAPICPYPCKRHSCFHIGHQRWFNGDNAKVYSEGAWRRARLRREIDSFQVVLAVVDRLIDMCRAQK